MNEKTYFVSIFFCLLMFSRIGHASEDQGLMPSTWYKLPEYGQNIDKSLKMSLSDNKPSEKFDRKVENLLKAQGRSYDELLDRSKYPLVNKSERWQLSLIKSDLALSAGGALGLLVLAGRISVELHWHRKEKTLKTEKKEVQLKVEEDPFSVVDINQDDSKQEVHLKKIVEKVAADLSVMQKENLISDLMAHSRKIKAMISGLPITHNLLWIPYKFRSDFSIQASGHAAPSVNVGGDIRLRLDWKIPEQAIPLKPLRSPSKYEEKIANSFSELVNTLGNDLSSFSKKDGPVGERFKAEVIAFLLGATIGGELGIAKLRGRVLGHLFFKKNKNYHIKNYNKALEIGDQKINVISKLDVPSDKSLNSLQDIPRREVLLDSFSNEKNLLNHKAFLYSLSRRKFRKGLEKAHSMSQYFAKKALESKHKYWGLKTIRTSFEMSLGGGLGLLTMDGMLGLRVYYTDKEW